MIMLKTLSESVAPLSGNFTAGMDSTMATITSLETALKGQSCTKSTKPSLTDSLLQMTLPSSMMRGMPIHSPHNVVMANNARAVAKPDLQANLFQAGFEDCASEVIRFLMEQEKMDGCDPLIQGLQSHLTKMSNTICPENIADLDKSQQNCYSSSIECDKFKDAQQNFDIKSSDISIASPVMEPVSLPQSSETRFDTKTSKNILRLSPESSDKRKHSYEDSTHTSSCQDVESTSSTSKRKCYSRNTQLPATKSDLLKCTEPVFSASSSDENSTHPGPKHALPVLHDSFSSFCNSSPQQPQPQQQSWFSANSFPVPGYFYNLPQPLGLSSPLLSSFPVSSPFLPHLFSSSSSSSPSPTTSSEAILSTLSHLQPADIPSTTSPQPSSAPDNLSSILELRAHFLPGIDTSSLASGNFADILLAVESCQSHENPRVRELADKILKLIHNTDEDDDEDDEDDESPECENEDDDGHGAGSAEHEDSGVDLGDDGTDWCSPVDMIEL